MVSWEKNQNGGKNSSIAKKNELKELVRHLDEPYQSYILKCMEEKGLKAQDVYEKAGLSKQRYYRIMCDTYPATREVILKLCDAVSMNEREINECLKKAGYTGVNSGEKTSERFIDVFTRMMKERSISNREICDMMNLHRNTLLQLRRNRDQRPLKETVVRLCIGCEFDYIETCYCLEIAGYVLSPSIKRDVIIKHYLKKGHYSVYKINEKLTEYKLPHIDS